MAMKFIPDQPVSLASVRQARDSLLGEQRIKCTEIAKLAGDRRRCSPNQFGESDHFRVVGLGLCERDLAVEIEREY